MNIRNEVKKYIQQINEIYENDKNIEVERKKNSAEFIQSNKMLPATMRRQRKNPYLKSIPSGVSDEYKLLVNSIYNFLRLNFNDSTEIQEFKQLKDMVNNGWQYKNIEIISSLEYFLNIDISRFKMTVNDEIQSKTQNQTDVNNFDKQNSLLQNLIKACIVLLNDFTYKDVIEDKRNDLIRNLLNFKEDEYSNVADQSRSGISSEGKSAGEADLIVRLADGEKSIIEGMNLNSVNKKYISEHINKIFNYDTLGNKDNYILSYVEIGDFEKFISGYLNYLGEHSYPKDVKLVEIIKLDKYNFSELSCIKTELKRNGVSTNIYHIVMHFR